MYYVIGLYWGMSWEFKQTWHITRLQQKVYMYPSPLTFHGPLIPPFPPSLLPPVPVGRYKAIFVEIGKKMLTWAESLMKGGGGVSSRGGEGTVPT